MLGRRTVGWSPVQMFRNAHCVRVALPTRGGNALTVSVRGETASWLGWPGPTAPDARQRVGSATAACRHASAHSDSSRARTVGPDQPGADAAECSPDVALWVLCPAIDPAHAVDKGGNGTSWLHIQRASSRQLRGVVPGQRSVPSGWRGNEKRPLFQDMAADGGSYPAAGAEEAGRVAICSLYGARAGANSVVSSNSRCRFHTHWLTIHQVSCPHVV